MLHRIGLLLEAIKFPHSVFALPFALVGLLVAARHAPDAAGVPPVARPAFDTLPTAAVGWPNWRVFLLVALCMVAARSAAMAFNRWADREFDAANPRTADRPTVTGTISSRALLAFTAAAMAVLYLAAWALNWTCLLLATPMFAVLLGYSYAKRFTSLSHFWLGLALGLAPVGAHLAVHGHLWPVPELGARWGLPVEAFPLILCAAVLFWTAGFDLIYACQDLDHDRQDPRLFSLPKSIGCAAALRLSGFLHAFTVALLAAAGAYAGLGPLYFGALVAVAALLTYEHWIVRPDDLGRVNTAFFTLNGAVSLLLLAAVVLEQAWQGARP